MVDAPSQGKWPIEQTTLFLVMYYPDNAAGTVPTETDNTIRDYNSAIDRCKEMITDNGNVGVAIIVPCQSTIVFPFIPWEAF